MSSNEQIEQTEQGVATPMPEFDTEQVVITVPTKLKRAFVATVEFVRSLFTGEVILNPTISKGFDYLFYMAVLFLFSILALFTSLHMQIKENRMAEQTTLLEERAIRTEEQRLRATTHSAIVNALKQRNIELYDAIEPVTVVKKGEKRRR